MRRKRVAAVKIFERRAFAPTQMKTIQNKKSNPALGDYASGAIHSNPGGNLSIPLGARARTKHVVVSKLGSASKAPQARFVFYSQVIIGSFIGLSFIAHSLSLPQLPYSLIGLQLLLCFVSFHPHLSKDAASLVSRLFRH